MFAAGPAPAVDGGEDMLAVTVCSMGADGTFEVMVKRDALVDDLVVAIEESRGISRLAIVLFLAGDEDPLAGQCPVAERMAGTGATELYMLLKKSGRQILEEIYNHNDGANWDPSDRANWMTDAPIGEWHGVTADADDVMQLRLRSNSRVLGK
jgi:hypothetical protein